MVGNKKRRKSRKLRGSCGATFGDRKLNEVYDLMVCMPKSVSALECKLLVKELSNRLASIGFTHMALTHTIYGRPKAEDRANVAIPDSLLDFVLSSTTTTTTTIAAGAAEVDKNKRKISKPNSCQTNNHIPRCTNRNEIRILRRLHVVVENLSDMSLYLLNGPQAQFLNEYDLISICPTNDGTFQSACSSATMADIITLDYTTRGMGLGYRIRSNDVKMATERGASFEISIAPALLHLKQRKALIHACHELKNNSLGMKIRMIVSSGDRIYEGKDVGALALRMPGDISNLCKAVMHFDPHTASKVVTSAPKLAVERGEERRLGRRRGIIGNVSLMNKAYLVGSSRSENDGMLETNTKRKNYGDTDTIDGESDRDTKKKLKNDDNVDDGFINF